jgi:hypothetical protein
MSTSVRAMIQGRAETAGRIAARSIQLWVDTKLESQTANMALFHQADAPNLERLAAALSLADRRHNP